MSPTPQAWSMNEWIPNHVNAAKDVVQSLLGQLEAMSWSEDDRFGIHLSVEEALMNAIKHGNEEDPAKRVHVLIEVSDDQVVVQIADEGSGFDPDDVPDPTLEENLEIPSGRGVMLMRSFMTRVEYNDVGNRVRMEKSRSASES